MSLTGSMNAAVSGLKAQSTALGITSDNIANLNTVGYKSSSAYFETIVIDSGGGGNPGYSPGGVVAGARLEADRQGLLQATDASTDVAMSGNGFFVVNRAADGSSDVLYTRAGSFRADKNGDLVNAAGYYLQGWELDKNGLLPGEPGNLDTTPSAEISSLSAVNIPLTTGEPTATTSIDIGANLGASQSILEGSGATATMDIASTTNYGIAADDIIIPDTAAALNEIVSGDDFTVTTDTGLTYTYTYGGFDPTLDVTGPGMFDATTANAAFFSTTPAPTGADATFTITNDTAGTVTFTYVTSTPNVSDGQFNSLNTLASAIDNVFGLTARVDGGIMYVSAETATEAVTFADGGATTWGATLGLTDITSAANRFSTLQGLNDLVNNSTGLSAILSNPTTEANLKIFVDDPKATITFTDGAANTGSLLDEFAITTNSGTGTPTTTGILTPRYDSAGTNGDNMASGNITPHFTRSIRVIDSQGTGHDMKISYVKLGLNRWGVEIYANDASEVSTLLPNGQVATGEITFNGDGTLLSVSSDLSNPITMAWTSGADPNEVTIDWGTAGLPFGTPGATNIGLSDGLSQFNSDFNVSFVNQDGAEVGTLVGVTIDDNGFVVTSYSSGVSEQLYKIPVATFSNPNGLSGDTGNVYSATNNSGDVFLREAQTNGAGKVVSSSLEGSNVDLATELTDMITTQRAYQANTRTITTADELLEELTRL